MSGQVLWAPWRMEFLQGAESKGDGGCVFCRLLQETDDKRNLIVHRGKHVFVILNKYPYNNGHLMIVPLRHTADFEELTEAETAELNRFTKVSMAALRKAYAPQGFNLGMNLGAAAGAGIREHLHLHVVPRWNGDTNFMPVLADTKAMPQHLSASYDQIHANFQTS